MSRRPSAGRGSTWRPGRCGVSSDAGGGKRPKGAAPGAAARPDAKDAKQAGQAAAVGETKDAVEGAEAADEGQGPDAVRSALNRARAAARARGLQPGSPPTGPGGRRRRGLSDSMRSGARADARDP